MSCEPCGCDPEANWTCQAHGGVGPAVHPTKAVPHYSPIPGVLVIGLGNKARHGKDTVAQFMVESEPANILRIGFADALYDYCRVEHGMTVKDAPLLQKVGVDMRARNPYTWIDAVYWKIVDKRPKVVVIPDTRFENEAAFVKQMGGYTIRVVRSNADGTPYVDSSRDPNHVSETQLDNYKWDLTLFNQTDLDELREKACFALHYVRGLSASGVDYDPISR